MRAKRAVTGTGAVFWLAMAMCGTSSAAQPTVVQDGVKEIHLDRDLHGSLGTESARLDDGSFFESYRFQGNPGARYAVTVQSDDFDAFVVVLDGYNASRLGKRVVAMDKLFKDLLARNDDISEETTDARAAFTARESGIVAVIANARDEAATGNYRISIEQLAPISTQQAQVGRMLLGQLGNESQRLDEDGSLLDWWALNLSPGVEYEATMESSDFDPFLIVTDAYHTPIASNDDDGNSLNAKVRFSLPEGGLVYIAANQSSTGSGSYRLRIVEVRPELAFVMR